MDAVHPEEIRVAVADESKLIEFDFESVEKKQIKSNIYLGKITRVEPSLQAAFVEYGGNRQGFLPFSEIHFDYFQIPVEDKEKLIRTLESERKKEEQRIQEMEAAESRAESRSEFRNESAQGNDIIEGNVSEPLVDGNIDDGRSEEQAVSEQPRENRREGRRDGRRDSRPGREGGRDGRPRRNDKRGERRGGRRERTYTERLPEAYIDIPPGFTTKDLPDLRRAEEVARLFTLEIMGQEYYDQKYNPKPAVTEEQQAPQEEKIAEEPKFEIEQQPVIAEEAPQQEPVQEILEPEMDEDDSPSEGGGRQMSRMEFYKQYKIQEVIKRNQIVLIQVVKEERGTKGASLTTYLALAGRYCVFMPNTNKGGGVSRRISNFSERRRIRDVIKQLTTPTGTSVIIRTAGMEREFDDIKKDYDYLLSLWDNIRKQTLESTAPSLIYEESDIVKRSLRDMLKGDVSEVIIEGNDTFKSANRFMEIIGPNQLSMLKNYNGNIPIFQKYKIEEKLDELYETEVKLGSGGSIVITPTEALVSIDVNSGKATKERNVEDTALKTNIEAAREIARQLKLRDLAGLIVIDFIDMREMRNRKSVERELRDALRADRAKIQLGRISAFGLLEMSRQRLRSSINESSSGKCPMCHGIGVVRTVESLTLKALRAIEAESGRKSVKEIFLRASQSIAHNLEHRRKEIEQIEKNDEVKVTIEVDTSLLPNEFEISTQKFSSNKNRKGRSNDRKPESAETQRPQQDVAEAGTGLPSEAKIDADVDEQLAAWQSEVADVEKIQNRRYEKRSDGDAPERGNSNRERDNRGGGNRGGRNNNRRGGGRNNNRRGGGGGRNNNNRYKNPNYNGDSFGNESNEDTNYNTGNYDSGSSRVERIDRYQPETPREENHAATAKTAQGDDKNSSSKLVGLWKKITS